MAKGSVRKKGKKWYYRFYAEDASGNLVQKECVGTESKSETEKLLRKAMEDYEQSKLIARKENITLGELLDIWAEEELKPGPLSNGTVNVYLGAIKRIKKYPIGSRKLKSITAEHLQEFVNLICFGGTKYDGTTFTGYSKDYIHVYTAILNSSFRFAVFPKRYITLNPMQYVILHKKQEQMDLFVEEIDAEQGENCVITHEQFETLTAYIKEHNPDALLPIQIAYYTGLRLGEVCALSWNDINLEEQYMTIRRSVKYNTSRQQLEFDTTKRNKIRIVDFCDTLADILKKAKKEQHKQLLMYGELYKLNYYQEVTDQKRIHYDWHLLGRNDIPPEDYNQISLVCIRQNGALEQPSTIQSACRRAKNKLDGLDDFHFHALRHTYTSNLLANGAPPKDVQELLGHSDVSTTMNVYAHATRDAKRSSAKLLDKVANGN